MRQAWERNRAGAWVLALLLMAGLGGCRCGEGTTPIGGGFTVSPERLDFGAALTGEVVVRPLLLGNDGRASRTLDLTTSAPFSAAARVELAAGELRTVDVTFLAGSELANGTLQVTDGERVVEVALVGEGVEPLQCVPSAPCRLSRFDLVSRSCVESVAAEGSSCTPTSLCLEKGTCLAGECLGTPRSCDDGNACTIDACAEGRGCVQSPRMCPPATKACHVPACNPTDGCGEVPAPEGTPCGLVGCDLAQLCVFGTCTDFAPAPDGLPCGPASPCRDGATCLAGTCDIKEPSPLEPAWSIALAGAPNGPLRGLAPNVFVEACDAADGACALRSFTSAITAGFQRFATPTSPELVPAAVDAAGVCLQEGARLASFSPTTGVEEWGLGPDALAASAGLEGWSAEGGEGRLALGAATDRFLTLTWSPPDGGSDTDGGLELDAGEEDAGEEDGGEEVDAGPELTGPVQSLAWLASDGGVIAHVRIAEAGQESRLALSVEGTLWLHDPDAGVLARTVPADGGIAPLEIFEVPPGGSGLAVAGTRLVVGGRTLVESDGGLVVATLELPAPGGAPVFEEREAPWVILDDERIHLLARPCAVDPEGVCTPVASLSEYSAVDGGRAWTVPLHPPTLDARPVEFAHLETGLGGAIGVLQAELPAAGPEGWVRFYGGGTLLEECRLDGPATPVLGLFQDGALYTVVERNGAFRLEAYLLRGLRSSTGGWPQVDGISGARRER